MLNLKSLLFLNEFRTFLFPLDRVHTQLIAITAAAASRVKIINIYFWPNFRLLLFMLGWLLVIHKFSYLIDTSHMCRITCMLPYIRNISPNFKDYGNYIKINTKNLSIDTFRMLDRRRMQQRWTDVKVVI